MGDEQRTEAAKPATAAAAEPRAGDENLPAGGAASAAPEITDDLERQNMLFGLATEVAYHGSREAWFGGLQRATLFVNVGLGAGLLAEYIPATLAGFLVAMASAMDVTFDFAGQARRHRDLRSRFMALAEEAMVPSCAQPAIRASMLRLDADAPPTYRAVEAVAYNQALDGLGRDRSYRLQLALHQRILRHVWPFGGATFESLIDREAAKAEAARPDVADTA